MHAYLADPTSITLTTSWQRFKITGTLASGQTGLWVIVRNFTGNGDEWANGTVIYLWGACLHEGADRNGPMCEPGIHRSRGTARARRSA